MYVHYTTVKGRRPENEDKHNIIININGTSKNKAPINFFSVYDGHGGDFVSNYLRINMPKVYCDKNQTYPMTPQQHVQISNEMENNIKLLPKNRGLTNGSTCLLLLMYYGEISDDKNNKIKDGKVSNNTKDGKSKVSNNNNSKDNNTKDSKVKDNTTDSKTDSRELLLNFVNVGDSRAVIVYKNGKFKQVTQDHTPLTEKKHIEKLGGKIKKDENGTWRISQLAIGRSYGDFDHAPFIVATPDSYYESAKNVKYIVMACDGLWDVMENKELFGLLENFKKNGSVNLASDLVTEALKRNTGDNVSLIILELTC